MFFGAASERERTHVVDVESGPPVHEAMNTDDGMTSTFTEQEDLSPEQLQTIKAKTMYQMVEDVNDGATKLLFLTNAQADLIASSPESVQKMLSTLDIGKPSLLINLLESPGDGEYCKNWSGSQGSSTDYGAQRGSPPFLSREDEANMEVKIDMFMLDVLIPLAAQTNAIVLCIGMVPQCILSASFNRMCSVAKSRWGGHLPFTVLSTLNNVEDLYLNPNLDAHWRSIRRQSRAWRNCDQTLLGMLDPNKVLRPNCTQDLDQNTPCLLITDNIDRKKHKIDAKPYNKLMANLVRHLSSTVPSIAIKTLMTCKFHMGRPSTSSLMMPADLVMGGTPVLCIDTRKRKPFALEGNNSRAKLIEAGKAQLMEWYEELRQAGLTESFDACSLAFLHRVLTGDDTPKPGGNGPHSISLGVPLHEAIRQARDDGDLGLAGQCDVVPQASPQQIADAAAWLTHLVFQNMWEFTPNREERESKGEMYSDFHKDRITAYVTYARSLLSSPNFYTVCLDDADGARRLVNKIVRLDRLPQRNPPEGLLLLRSAWYNYDVAMMFGDRYKRICKIVFATQLFLGWLVVFGSVMKDYILLQGQQREADMLKHAVFGATIMVSLLVTLEGIISPKSRWRHCRSSAGVLQATIWLYRTRVGPFEIDDTRRDSTMPETAFCASLTNWRDHLIAGAGLKTTNLMQEFPGTIYKHFQREGAPVAGGDDFQSPTHPTRYIELRILPMINFYKHRIPMHTRRNIIFKVCVLLVGVIATVLARYDETRWVATASALGAAMVTWSEFSDSTAKVERYSKSINALENLLSWWDSLGDVQKASKDAISNLVRSAESVISEEQVAWTSAPSQASVQDDKKRDAEGDQNQTKLA